MASEARVYHLSFSNNTDIDRFLYLCQHRFASHCCETLFLQAAPIVNQELAQSTHQLDIQNGDVYVSMENLFLYTLNELEGNLGFLITDPFGSHVLRVLLLVLSGRPLKDSNTISLLRSRKKETVSTAAQTIVESTIDELPRTIPLSFQNAVDRIITKATADLDTRTVRALSNHPTGNPVLQLMLELELSTNGKAKAKEPGTIFYKLVPDQNIEEGSETCAFLRDLAYDTIGSRLLEVIIKFAAGKTFKSLYRVIFRDRLAMFAKNEIAGYVVSKLLERLGKEDLKQASEQLCSQMGLLVERSKTSIIRTLIDRCYVRETDTSQISAALQRAYGIDPAQRLLMMLNLNIDTREATANHPIELLESQNKAGVHGSLLAQSMLEKPGPLRELIDDALLAMNPNVLLIIAKDRVASRVLQTSLVCQDQPTKFRRILVQHFLGHIAELATDPISSHVIDAFWKGTMSMTFIRERIANELSEGESRLRESYFGRAVWKNWKMDLYKTRKRDWIAIARSGHKQSTTSMDFARARFTKAEKTDAKKSI